MATYNYLDKTGLGQVWSKIKNYINNNFLSKTNTTAYTPTTDYHPATKKYVDDSVPTVPTKVSQLTNDSGYISSYTETDPIFTASAAHGITSTDISNWNSKTSNTGTVTKVIAGTGLSIGTTASGNFTTSGTINHTNSVTAQNTQAIYPIKIDAQGHISGYGSAVTPLTASSTLNATKLSGTVPTACLPSYVDDVLEYSAKSSFPATGETGKIYVDTTANLTYRWGGSAYVEISPSLALGTTSSTAFRGDYGNSAYTHAVTNKGSAFSSGFYKITTNSEGHVTGATAVQKSDITGLGIPAQDTTYTFDGTYNASTNKAATVSTVNNALVNTALTGTTTAELIYTDELTSGNLIVNGGASFVNTISVGSAPTSDMNVATKKYVDNSLENLPASAFYINITSTEQNNKTVYTADKTFAQIEDAYNDNSVLICIFDGIYYSLNYKDDYGFDFCDTSSSIYEYRINEWHGYRDMISISDDNSISRLVQEVPIPQNIVQLTDTTISSPTNGQFLQYNSSTSKWENKTYTAPVTSVNGQTGAVAVAVPTKTSDLTNDSGFMTGMTILSYGSSSWADFIDAYTNKRVVYCRASSNSNPASGSQTRLAFMAYANNADNPTEVEFQYYRSVSSHSNNQQGDQVYVYKLNKSSGWSVTVRESYTKVVAGTGLIGNWATGAITLGLSSTIPVGSTATPQPLGTASAGSSSDFSKADHVHALPTLSISSNVITLTGASGQTTSVTLPVYNGGVSS